MWGSSGFRGPLVVSNKGAFRGMGRSLYDLGISRAPAIPAVQIPATASILSESGSRPLADPGAWVQWSRGSRDKGTWQSGEFEVIGVSFCAVLAPRWRGDRAWRIRLQRCANKTCTIHTKFLWFRFQSTQQRFLAKNMLAGELFVNIWSWGSGSSTGVADAGLSLAQSESVPLYLSTSVHLFDSIFRFSLSFLPPLCFPNSSPVCVPFLPSCSHHLFLHYVPLFILMSHSLAWLFWWVLSHGLSFLGL